MRKGIVMEVNDPYLTLLTSDGEFLHARKMDRFYSIGEEIDFFPVADYVKSKKTNSFKNFLSLKTFWMSMAVLLISLGSIIPVYQNNKAYAYMSIDADSSIEMGLNKNMQVVELKGFNKEAEQIIAQLDDWEKKDASELAAIIISELKNEGYITKADPVVISSVKTNQLKDETATKLQENIKEIKQTVDKNLVEVNMYTTTEAEIEKAQDLGVPVGVYHRNKSEKKNNSAQNKKKIQPSETKKINQEESTPPEPTANSTLPPGQVKKQEQDNSNLIQNQSQNNETNITPVPEQGNGKQDAAPGKTNNGNNGNDKQNNDQGKPKEDKIIIHDYPKTNNENKVKKNENNGKK